MNPVHEAKTRLILFTNEFPYKEGDVDFVRSEIDALAAAFEEIEVFNYSRALGSVTVELPSNVTYRGNLYGGPRFRPLFALLIPAVLFRFLHLIQDEASSGRLRGQWKTGLVSALASVKRARDPRLRAILKDRKPSTVLYSFWGMGAGMAVPMVPRPSGGAFVRLHRYDLYDTATQMLPLRKSIYRVANALLPVSEDGRNYLIANFGNLVTRKVIVSRLGSRGRGTLTRPPRTKERVIVSCSSVSAVKRVDSVLDALASHNWSEPVRWVHFGGGPQLDMLLASAEAVDTPRLTIEIRGQVENEEVLSFYRDNRVDVFVNVSSSEGVPVSIMEALSFGIPVLATDVGGTGEIVSAALGSGLLVPKDIAGEDLANEIDAVLAADDNEFSSRKVWERLCDSERNSGIVTRILLSQVLPADVTAKVIS